MSSTNIEIGTCPSNLLPLKSRSDNTEEDTFEISGTIEVGIGLVKLQLLRSTLVKFSRVPKHSGSVPKKLVFARFRYDKSRVSSSDLGRNLNSLTVVSELLVEILVSGTLKGKSSPASSSGSGKASINDEDWEELDDRAASAIRLCLAKNVLANGDFTRCEWLKEPNFLITFVFSMEIVYLEEVTSSLLSEERRLSGESTKTTDVSALEIMGNWKKDKSKKK
ncbi:hypothetical protein WN944_022559 [Citrus x changshan-huyou]|uniref:Uncharacterized protein n=1 Tax=Citrus x changshan-huyou TaxID=2935761 RepID=A0AAP0N349_9ROSI